MNADYKKRKIEHRSFLWGVVNIGAQTEGGDYYSNWSAWARRGVVPRIGAANDYIHRYAEDHDLVEELGCNSMRITIEWSRIEPQEDEFNHEAMMWYIHLLRDLRKRKIKTVVGLWHWQVPLWCEEKYGMHNEQIVRKFERYVQYVCKHIGDMVDYVVTINEPVVFIQSGYLIGSRPPFFKNSFGKMYCTAKILIMMHVCTYRIWKERYPQAMVGATHLWNDERGAYHTIMQNAYLGAKRYFSVAYFIEALLPFSDFIGINFYTSNRFFFGKSGGRWGVHGTNDWHSTDVWKSFPEGLYRVLMRAKKYHKPLMVLENGKPTNAGIHDVDRQEFLKKTLSYVQKAIDHGVDVRGYFHYCLCDSYEWESGYDFKFGLVEIDRATGERRCRDSFFTYKDFIKKLRV